MTVRAQPAVTNTAGNTGLHPFSLVTMPQCRRQYAREQTDIRARVHQTVSDEALFRLRIYYPNGQVEPALGSEPLTKPEAVKWITLAHSAELVDVPLSPWYEHDGGVLDTGPGGIL